jgi:phospholipid/cholesterol/gamma-HCH transport system substrate-binding protein
MKTKSLELFAGLFLTAGILCLAFLSIKIARKEFFTSSGYPVQAVFSNCSGLKNGAAVMIAGVEIGRVKSIALVDYEAKVGMVINPGIELQTDSIASIKTKGLIGEKYIEIKPGAAEQNIAPGGLIRDTEPTMDIEGLISKFVQGNVSQPAK